MSFQNLLYATALGVTLCSEFPVIWIGLRGLLPFQRRPLLAMFGVFLSINLFTHGTLWSFWHLLPKPYVLSVLVGEGLVWLVETLLYWQLLGLPFGRVLWVVGAANLLSTLLGLGVWWLLL